MGRFLEFRPSLMDMILHKEFFYYSTKHETYFNRFQNGALKNWSSDCIMFIKIYLKLFVIDQSEVVT